MENMAKSLLNSLHSISLLCSNVVYDDAPTMEQSGLISILVGAGAWFGLYVNLLRKNTILPTIVWLIHQ